MAWEKKYDGHYERELGENETLIKLVGDRGHAFGREHWSVSTLTSFESTGFKNTLELATTFRQAWVALRYEHPGVASIARESIIQYTSPKNDSALEDWVHETFFVVDSQKSADNVVAEFKPTLYATLHYLPATAQIILHTAHWRADEIGAQHLVDSLFQKAVHIAEYGDSSKNFDWGSEAVRLMPSIEEALMIPEKSTKRVRAETQNLLTTYSLAIAADRVTRADHAKTVPGGTHSVRSTLSKGLTARIMQFCLERDFPLIAVVHAAVSAIDVRGAPEDIKPTTHTSTLRFNLRPYLRKPGSAGSYASALCVGEKLLRAPASRGWSENVRAYAEVYSETLSEDFLQARRLFASKMVESLRTTDATKTTRESEPLLGGIQVVGLEASESLVAEVYEGGGCKFEILSTSFGVETTSRQMFCCFGQFRGQIELNLVYNEACYERSFVEGLLHDLEQVLEKEMC